MGVRNIKKQLIGKEDLELGFGQIIQERSGKNLEINRINAGIIPYTEDKSVSDVLDSLANVGVKTLASGTTTTSVLGCNLIINQNDSSTTLLTLTEGAIGQTVTIRPIIATTTVSITGIDIAIEVYKTLTVIFDGDEWIEIARTF